MRKALRTQSPHFTLAVAKWVSGTDRSDSLCVNDDTFRCHKYVRAHVANLLASLAFLTLKKKQPGKYTNRVLSTGIPEAGLVEYSACCFTLLQLFQRICLVRNLASARPSDDVTWLAEWSFPNPLDFSVI